MSDYIEIKNAYANNLKNIDLRIPKNKLVVITGLSGSGKSSIAFDILDNESRRQYMESLGMITDGISKAECDYVKSLPPSISIEQHLNNKNPRSTVGTITELYTYIRILFAKLGKLNGANKGWSMSDFSFNKPSGACPHCTGMGLVNEVDIDYLLDSTKSIVEGAVKEWDIHYIRRNADVLHNAAEYYGFRFDINEAVESYDYEARMYFLYGSESKEVLELFPEHKIPKTSKQGRFEGIISNINRRHSEKANNKTGRDKFEKYFHERECPVCSGKRLNNEISQVSLGGSTIIEVQEMDISALKSWIDGLSSSLDTPEFAIASPIISDLNSRIAKLLKVGVGYLSLIRSVPTLSGGEAQRLKIANLISSGLSGVLYILDEPTKGLHGSDVENLLDIIEELKNQGNHIVMIEHNITAIKRADYIIDMGPGSGKYGGRIVAEGSYDEIVENPNSKTARFMRSKLTYMDEDNCSFESSIRVKDINLHNVSGLSIEIPTNNMIGVSGVSGSGKSTVFLDVLSKELVKFFKSGKLDLLDCKSIEGIENLNGVRVMSQKSAGRSSRSNPATYTGIFDDIRKLYSRESHKKGLKHSSGHFSFNTEGGRCEKCKGTGYITTSMHFLPDVRVVCSECDGKRYNDEILSIEHNGCNISQVLNITVEEAIKVFSESKKISKKLALLHDVGVGYLQLGQEFSTLSGGEIQRLKLAKDLIDDDSRGYLYIFDEPSSGLHFTDSEKIIDLFKRIVSKGNTVIVIEHNPQFLLQCDQIIDLGPGGGESGGELVYQGSVSELLKSDTLTSKYLNSLI